MPHFTLQLSTQGPLLDAVVRISHDRHLALTAAGLVVPNPVPIRALVDTGASATCVDPSVLTALSLSPTGNTSMITPSTGATPISVDQYDVSLSVPPGLVGQNALIFN